MKKVKYPRKITKDDYLDITIFHDKEKIFKFSLNYWSKIKGKFVPIYRVENYHGYLHEQRFWRANKPIPLDNLGLSNNQIVDKYVDEIFNNFQKYKKYYKKVDEK